MRPIQKDAVGRRAIGLVTRPAAVFIAVSIFLVACGGGGETNPERLVPEGANLMGKINVAGILASDVLESPLANLLMGENDPQSLDELFDQAMSETGIDVRQISQAVVFSDVSRTDDFWGVIAKGAFDEVVIVKALEKQEGRSMDTSVYKGRRIHSFGDYDETSLAFLDGEHLVLGTQEGVRAVIDVQDGHGERVSGPLPDALDDLGPGLISLAAETPEGLQDQLSDLGDIPLLGDGSQGVPAILGPLEDFELLGLALSQNGQILILKANLDFASEDSASYVGEFLEGGLVLVSGLIPDTDVRELLENLEVSAIGSRLSIRLEMTASEIERLVEGLEGS